MKSFKIPIFLIIIMIMASFPGIYAINTTQQDNNVNIGEISNVADGARTLYVSKNGTDRNDGLTPENPKRNIENALATAKSGDTIKVGPGTYNTNLQIHKNITLIGDNQNNTLIDGQQLHACVHIQSATVTIINFTIKNGRMDGSSDYEVWTPGGGGICNMGELYIENSTIKNNTQTNGGGIYNEGKMTMKGVTITNNKAGHNGGGIYNEGTMNMNGVTITNNKAEYNGGAIHNYDNTINMNGVTITNNKAGHNGGGIHNYLSSINMNGVTITTNIAEENGGGIYNSGYGPFCSGYLDISGVTIENNKAGHNGGGICNNGEFIIKDSTIVINNKANHHGGGICNYGTSTVHDSTITNNKANHHGGGIYNANLLTVYGSTITNNKAKNSGGGIYNVNNITTAYLDDITVNLMGGNSPDNFAGKSFIPA
jgi:predicted outer membrane repeat protein